MLQPDTTIKAAVDMPMELALFVLVSQPIR